MSEATSLLDLTLPRNYPFRTKPMHWMLDVAFGEDQCRVRGENAAQNFAILRRITMNMLLRDTSTKAGIKIRRMKAATSDHYRAELIGWQGTFMRLP